VSSVSAPVFPVEVIRCKLTAATAADFAVHYGHLQQLLRERQLEQQWQHLYSTQCLTQQSGQQQQFQQQLKTLKLHQQQSKGSDEQEQQQQPQLQQRSAQVQLQSVCMAVCMERTAIAAAAARIVAFGIVVLAASVTAAAY
jgi:hypothetical protein